MFELKYIGPKQADCPQDDPCQLHSLPCTPEICHCDMLHVNCPPFFVEGWECSCPVKKCDADYRE